MSVAEEAPRRAAPAPAPAATASPAAARSRSRSLLAEVFSEHEDALAGESLTLLIPGRDRKLAARYRVLGEEEIARLSQAEGVSASTVNASLIAEACVCLLARDKSGTLVDLEDDRGRPLRFGPEFASMLGQDGLGTAAEIVAFAFRGNSLAIGRHGDKVVEWMSDTSADVEGAVLGK